jgi:hypothetical protein
VTNHARRAGEARAVPDAAEEALTMVAASGTIRRCGWNWRAGSTTSGPVARRSEFSIDRILALENYGGRLIDYGVILPKMQALYDFAAADLAEPRLLGLVRNGFPVYAWPYEDRIAWTTTRPLVRSVLSWLTSA